jgi:hypothetical protein
MAQGDNRGAAMEQTLGKQNISVNQQPQEWVKLIRKLRWIGMEDEAHRLQMAVCSLPPHERGTVLAAPFSTD